MTSNLIKQKSIKIFYDNLTIFIILSSTHHKPQLSVRIQLKGMGLESHIGNRGFLCEICKALSSPTTMASFCDVVLPMLLSIGIKAFDCVSATNDGW